jgi:hypothetical protein
MLDLAFAAILAFTDPNLPPCEAGQTENCVVIQLPDERIGREFEDENGVLWRVIGIDENDCEILEEVPIVSVPTPVETLTPIDPNNPPPIIVHPTPSKPTPIPSTDYVYVCGVYTPPGAPLPTCEPNLDTSTTPVISEVLDTDEPELAATGVPTVPYGFVIGGLIISGIALHLLARRKLA